MNQLNNILLEGTVVTEPKTLAQAGPCEKWGRFVKFEMLSVRQYRNRKEEIVEEKLWIGVQCWGHVAEEVSRHLEKDIKLRVVGRLKLNQWKGNDGKSRRSMEIVASHIEFRRKWEKDDGKDPRFKGKSRPEDIMVLDDGNDMQRTGEPEFVYTYD